MTTSRLFQAFLNKFQIAKKQPLSESEIVEIESKTGLSFPETYRTCYLTCDGGQAQDRRSALEILSLRAVLDYDVALGSAGLVWGLAPFSENNDSNPICVCCKPPLTGYVVLVPHDDAPRLKFRSLENFFEAAIDYVGRDKFLDTYSLPSDFSGPERTEQDLEIARQLVQMVQRNEPLSDDERTHSLRFACDLFSDLEIDEIVSLIDIGDEYVHQHVVERLRQIPAEKAKNALTHLAKEFDEFVDGCAERLRLEMVQASVHSEYGSKSIQVDPGPIWLNMKMFFAIRNQPDFESYFLGRVKYLIEQNS